MLKPEKSLLMATSVVLNSLCVPLAAADQREAVLYTDTAPVIDGDIDPMWQQGLWSPMQELILGEQPTAEDFSGVFKLRWDEQYLYLLAVIQDDVLSDVYANPVEHYWDDDSLEIFLDPDGSGGDHLYSYNAFAYHLALDGNAVDLGDKPDQILRLNEHVDNAWQRSDMAPYPIVWEARIKLYSEKWGELGEASRITLKPGHNLGFMLAYCDGDGKGVREHFVGSQSIIPINGSKDLGYKTADVFTPMQLIKAN